MNQHATGTEQATSGSTDGTGAESGSEASGSAGRGGERRRTESCEWCGRTLASAERGRKRRYCKQSCRQRAYEQRSATVGTSIPGDAVILSKAEADELIDRLYVLRCAAEDLVTAVDEGADAKEFGAMAQELLASARDAERLRS